MKSVTQCFDCGFFNDQYLVSKHCKTFLIYLFDKIIFCFIYFLWEPMLNAIINRNIYMIKLSSSFHGIVVTAYGNL
jgi:hypothetical protein